MNCLRLTLLASTLFVLTTHAVAQSPGTPAPKGAIKPVSAPAAASAASKVTGPVKGAVTGKTFVVSVPRKGPITLDATGATIRNSGKFASINDIRGGTFVQASGAMNGTMLRATEVNILRQAGGKSPKPATPPAAGAKHKP